MELNVDEALRYLGIGGQAAESIRASVAAVADKLTAAIQPRYTYRVCSLQKTEAGFLLPEAELVLPGADAAKMLEQCDQAVLMACTLGTQFEASCVGNRLVICPGSHSGCLRQRLGGGRVRPGGAGTGALSSEPLQNGPVQSRVRRSAVVFAAEDLRRTGYPKAAWTVCNRELFDEPIQVSHRHHRLVRLAQMARIRGCTYCSMRETCKLRVEENTVGIEIPQNKFLILDGAMGTVLQQRGLSPQGRPELLNLTEPELLDSVYKEYIAAGSQVIYANTFGANGLKLAKTGHSVEEVVGAAIAVAKKAAAGTGTLVALDVGPLGELLEPMGTLSFERAYDLFREWRKLVQRPART